MIGSSSYKHLVGEAMLYDFLWEEEPSHCTITGTAASMDTFIPEKNVSFVGSSTHTSLRAHVLNRHCPHRRI